MKRRLIYCLVSLMLLSGLAVYNSGCSEKSRTISVRLKWLYAAGFAGDMIALKKGFFEKNGLAVELHEGGFNLDPIKLVASGSDQIGTAGADQILLARAQGLPLVCIAVVFQSSPVVFLTRKDSGITKPNDFVGRTVGIQPATDVMPIYEALLRKLSIDRKEIQEIPIQYSLTPFLEKQIDVLPAWATNQTYILDKMGIKYNLIDPREYGINVYGMCYFTTEKMIAESPDLLQLYIDSVIKGYRWAFDNKDSATQIVISFSDKLDYQQERYQLGELERYVIDAPDRRLGWMTKDKWGSTQQLYLDVGMLKGAVDLNKVYTTQFLERIYAGSK